MGDYEPHPGNYFCTRTDGIAALGIRLGTFSHWNHSGIYIGGGKTIEAKPRGVTIGNLSDYNTLVWNRHDVISDEQFAGIIAYGRSRVDDPYGFLEIDVLALRILGLKVFSEAFAGILNESKGVICSQLVELAYRSVGIVLVNKADYLVTPEDLAERNLFL
jgi:uncharacterized protein YycO